MTDEIKKDDVKKDEQSFDTAQAIGSEAQARRDELKALQLKCEEYLNGWKRERADFLNYKKDEMERIGQLVKYSNEELILKIIPILDNIYLAEMHVPEEITMESPSTSSGQTSQAWKVWIQGFNAIKNQLCDFLAKEGIEQIKTLYEKFDPNTMEVVEEVSGREMPHNADGWKAEEPGIVVEETQKGYMMYGKIIRVAKVKVSK